MIVLVMVLGVVVGVVLIVLFQEVSILFVGEIIVVALDIFEWFVIHIIVLIQISSSSSVVVLTSNFDTEDYQFIVATNLLLTHEKFVFQNVRSQSDVRRGV